MPTLDVGSWGPYTPGGLLGLAGSADAQGPTTSLPPTRAASWMGCCSSSSFPTPGDVRQHTQLVTPKSMSRMAVPAKAAMVLRMLVPRLLLTCWGRDGGEGGGGEWWWWEGEEGQEATALPLEPPTAGPHTHAHTCVLPDLLSSCPSPGTSGEWPC